MSKCTLLAGLSAITFTSLISTSYAAPLAAFGVNSTTTSQQNTEPKINHHKVETTKEFVAKDYSSLLGLPGFSDKMLNNHFKLYQGYVKNANLILKELKDLDSNGKSNTPAFSELRRRFGWEFDGMRLHEYYFDNLSKTNKDILSSSDLLCSLMERDFGSVENWKKDFITTGAMRGIGWAILYYDHQSGRLFNTWINEHDLGHLAGGFPLLVMDVFEHAYMTDYELDRAAYIQAFMQNVNWGVVKKRMVESEILNNRLQF